MCKRQIDDATMAMTIWWKNKVYIVHKRACDARLVHWHNTKFGSKGADHSLELDSLFTRMLSRIDLSVNIANSDVGREFGPPSDNEIHRNHDANYGLSR